MNILITGGCGFVGARLARTLLKQRDLSLAGGSSRRIDHITLTDRVEPPPDLTGDARIAFVQGDLLDLAQGRKLPAAGTELVFHMAGAVSAECEADFDLGMHSNFDTIRALLEACRALGSRPTVVFASSLAVFGNAPGTALPALIEDDTLPTPQSSYGIQKFIGEQLVADYARKGFIRGRNVRLMTVSVRPGKPNGAASGFLSGMVREPLAGLKGACPVPRETPVALASPARTVEGLIRAAEASDQEWGPLTGMNLPSMLVTAGEMADALERVAGKPATALLDWTPDPAILKLVNSWPGNVASTRARALGLQSDKDFESVIREYVRENPDAVKLPLR